MVQSRQNNWGSLGTYTTVSDYGYAYDAFGRRTHKQRSGAAFSAFYETFGYNDRGELTSTDYFTGTFNAGTAVDAKDRRFAYDPIGNRTTSLDDRSWVYNRNALNQYTVAAGRPGAAMSGTEAGRY